MGRLQEGQWIVEDVNPKTKTGEYVRQDQKFRDTIVSGGEFSPEVERYHLYVSYACPWAHRTLIMRKLKSLDPLIPVSVVSPNMMDKGWSFKSDFNGVTPEPVFSVSYLKDLYTQVDPQFSGRVTVPVLFDKKLLKIVNNESAEVIRIFNSAFNEITGNSDDYYPESLREEIDRLNADIYPHINNGVYKAGFARTQEAYDKNVRALFEALDRIEHHLEGRMFFVGEKLTEADIRLYTTLVRFDVVYYVHFKCCYRRIKDYKNLSSYLRRLYALPAFNETTHFDHIQQHYFYSHATLNPFRIVPYGPADDPPFGGLE